jgi:hypothetical protein
VIGVRMKGQRHIEDEVHQAARYVAENWGEVPVLCGVRVQPDKVVRREITEFAPAVICADCIYAAREWYAASYFVPFDTVQRWRLLAALDYDLEVAG